MNAQTTPVGLQADGLIISRCGLICNTCTAFMTGACPGCHKLSVGDCIVRDCADLLGTSCLDCQVDSCYHYEAYALRRSLMNSKAKRYYRLLNPTGGSGTGGGCGGGCSSGGGCGGASGCGSKQSDSGAASGCGSCPAARFAQTLAALE